MFNGSMQRFVEGIGIYPKTILWKESFVSFNGQLQDEIIARISACFLYAQTKHECIQPVWLFFEHKPSKNLENILKYVSICHTVSVGEYNHTRMKIEKRNIFEIYSKLTFDLQISKAPQKAFCCSFLPILNHKEAKIMGENKEQKEKRKFEKVIQAGLGKNVTTFSYNPQKIKHLKG